MPKKLIPTTNFPSDAFSLAAGSVMFRTDPQTNNLQVCLVYNTKTKRWILPKGRKDQGEYMHVTAVRETFEETGFPCELYPCKLPTKAPPPGVNVHPSLILTGEDLCEPFYTTVRQLKDGTLKTIWWYLTWLKDNSAPKVLGTLMPSEQNYVSDFYDVQNALGIMAHHPYQNILSRAVELVQQPRTDSEPTSSSEDA